MQTTHRATSPFADEPVTNENIERVWVITNECCMCVYLIILLSGDYLSEIYLGIAFLVFFWVVILPSVLHFFRKAVSCFTEWYFFFWRNFCVVLHFLVVQFRMNPHFLKHNKCKFVMLCMDTVSSKSCIGWQACHVTNLPVVIISCMRHWVWTNECSFSCILIMCFHTCLN